MSPLPVTNKPKVNKDEQSVPLSSPTNPLCYLSSSQRGSAGTGRNASTGGQNLISNLRANSYLYANKNYY